jgi:hypothetical protein
MRPDALTPRAFEPNFAARFVEFAGFTEFAEFARGSFTFENQLKKPIYFTVDI